MVLFLLIGIAVIQGLVSLRDGLRNTRYALEYRRHDAPRARIVVFCPVKGVEADLEANARSLLGQRYPDFRVVFLLDAADDPAARVLSTIGGAEVLIGGRSVRRGQKVHNLLAGIDRFGSDGEVWVFADADACFPSDWLEQLTAPLADPAVGATTGYRWYIPEQGSTASLMRSAWNATVAGFLGPHANNFVWGGSTGIRRDTFISAGIGTLWDQAVSDDYALTTGVHRQGLRIVYVPTCLVPAYEGCDWRGLVEFTTRQIRITRIYAPAIWRIGLITNTLFNLTFWWLALLILTGRWGLIIPWLVVYGLTVVRSDVRLCGIRHSIDHPSLERHAWFYRLSTPLVTLLYQLNFLLSVLSRRIIWKGVAYTMVSPEETRVEFL